MLPHSVFGDSSQYKTVERIINSCEPTAHVKDSKRTACRKVGACRTEDRPSDLVRTVIGYGKPVYIDSLTENLRHR